MGVGCQNAKTFKEAFVSVMVRTVCGLKFTGTFSSLAKFIANTREGVWWNDPAGCSFKFDNFLLIEFAAKARRRLVYYGTPAAFTPNDAQSVDSLAFVPFFPSGFDIVRHIDSNCSCTGHCGYCGHDGENCLWAVEDYGSQGCPGYDYCK